jgi:hypothetical protein
MKEILSQEKIMEILGTLYNKAIGGIPGSESCFQLADDYSSKNKNIEIAARKLINFQLAKCTATGFLTGLGGILTLPVALPANLASIYYIQLRMIATLAVLGGYDPKRDEVQTLVYLCLINMSIKEVCGQVGVQVANKAALALLKRLPGKILTEINKKIGFRLFTKFGEKGVINLIKVIPLAGGFIGGGVDLVSAKITAERAYKVFILNESD